MLEVAELRKRYSLPAGKSFNALDGISFTVAEGAFFTLLGPSGCGKTTTLRSIAGLDVPDSGAILVNGSTVFDSKDRTMIPPNKRRLGMVFQSYAIWPHMNVFENVAFPLQVARHRLGAAQIKQKVAQVLETVRLAGYEHRPAVQLSGGQQQRLAIARALAMEPRLLLLDEPLSNLDASLRESMCFELRRLQRESGITTVYVTHDQSEALSLSDMIAVMDSGRIVQIGDAQSVYLRPQSRFVAEFIGTTNLLEVRATQRVGACEVGAFDWRGITLHGFALEEVAAGDALLASIRPEQISIEPAGTVQSATSEGSVEMRGRVAEQLFLGSKSDMVVIVSDSKLRVSGRPRSDISIGTEVTLRVGESDCLIVPNGTPAAAGTLVEAGARAHLN